jgi:hypothetical protein
MSITPEQEACVNGSPFRTAAELVAEEVNAGRMDIETALIFLTDILARAEDWEEQIISIREQMSHIPEIERQIKELKDKYEQQKDELRDEYCRWFYGTDSNDPAERNLPPPRSREEIQEGRLRCEADYQARNNALNNEWSTLLGMGTAIDTINSRALSVCRSLECRIMRIDLSEMAADYDDLLFSAGHPELADKRRELQDLWECFAPGQKKDFINKMVESGKWDRNELETFLAVYVE